MQAPRTSTRARRGQHPQQQPQQPPAEEDRASNVDFASCTTEEEASDDSDFVPLEREASKSSSGSLTLEQEERESSSGSLPRQRGPYRAVSLTSSDDHAPDQQCAGELHSGESASSSSPPPHAPVPPPREPDNGFCAPPAIKGHKHRSLKLKRRAPPQSTASASEPPPKRLCSAAETHERTIGSFNPPKLTFIDLSVEDDDPIGVHVACTRLTNTVASENKIAQDIVSALGVVSDFNFRVKRSVIDNGGTKSVRQTLRTLLSMSTSATSVATRKAARKLIALDREMTRTAAELDASLRCNPHVKDLMHEHFLRDNPCPICQDPFVNAETAAVDVVRFACDHAVHTECMADWYRLSDPRHVLACPVCRAPHFATSASEQCGVTADPRQLPGLYGDAVFDHDAPDESDESEPESDEEFRGRLPPDPSMLAADRVTRSVARGNVCDGVNPFTPR